MLKCLVIYIVIQGHPTGELECDEKLEFSLAQMFVMMGKVMPVVFREIKMSFWVRVAGTQ